MYRTRKFADLARCHIWLIAAATLCIANGPAWGQVVEVATGDDDCYECPTPGAPGEDVGDDVAVPDEAFAPVAAPAGGAAGPMAGVPGMLGDLGGGTLAFGPAVFGSGVVGSNVALAGGDRRFKIVENTSPLPRDRVFLDYHYFNNSLIAGNGIETDLHRWLLGIERTFGCGMNSIEVRVPFAQGLDEFQTGVTTDKDVEFGDLGLAYKRILYQDCTTLVSTGLAMTLPTGSDGVLSTVRVENEAVHLQPFFGFVNTMDSLFVQGMIQLDFDVNGNVVRGGAGVADERIEDMDVLYLSVSTGYWLYRSCCCSDPIAGIAPIFEIHYTTTIEDPDVDAAGAASAAGARAVFREGRYDLLNAAAGVHVAMGNGSALRVIASAPLRGETFTFAGTGFDADRFYDYEIAVQYNLFY